MKEKGQIRIGLSNVTLPGNKQSFPPAFQSKSRLHYYSTIFNTVEVNSCFYKTPMLSTYEKWRLDVPDDFQFSLKLTKEVTHTKELEGDLTCMEKFMQTAAGTGNKKGCLLIQFPGKINLEHFEKVELILEELEKHDPLNHWKKAVEFRNPTWYTRETWDLLDEFGATMVLHDMQKARITEQRGHANFIYLRFHGPTGNYRGSYSDEFLKEKSEEIIEWLEEGKDVYAYFNNTAGNAYENAISLKTTILNQNKSLLLP